MHWRHWNDIIIGNLEYWYSKREPLGLVLNEWTLAIYLSHNYWELVYWINILIDTHEDSMRLNIFIKYFGWNIVMKNYLSILPSLTEICMGWLNLITLLNIKISMHTKYCRFWKLTQIFSIMWVDSSDIKSKILHPILCILSAVMHF